MFTFINSLQEFTPPPTNAPTTKPPAPPPTKAATTKPPTPPPAKAPTTKTPTQPPTKAPTTKNPTQPPTKAPTTKTPTQPPTKTPTTKNPTQPPTKAPTTKPPTQPSTKAPTTKPPTQPPTKAPTTKPPTQPPTKAPTTKPPTTATKLPTKAATTTACSASRAYCPNCGQASISVPGLRIVNGTDAEANEYPYHVGVYPEINGSHIMCAGSIIKKNWILTAAHCMFDQAGNNPAQNGIGINYGHANVSNVKIVKSIQYFIHEDYNDTKDYIHDIALIKTATPLNYENDPTFQPICLAEESDIPFEGQAVATGWGDMSNEGGTRPDILKEVALDILNNSRCEELGVPTNVSTVVCGLTPFKDTCKGDSGGPLVVEICPNLWVQIGVVSYGAGCAQPNNPGIYTRVPAYRSWIDKITGSSTAC